MDMFVIITIYRVRAGEEDAIIALHEDKVRDNQFNAQRYLCWELVRKLDEPQEFISIAQFANKRQAQAATRDLEKDAWLSRLTSLMEGTPVYSNYKTVWSMR